MRGMRGTSGFTLLEIVVVVFIMGVLVALVAPQIMSRIPWAMVRAAKTEIKSLEMAVRTFRVDNGRFPTTAEGLSVLVPPPPAQLPNYDSEGYMERLPDDPWGHPYVYTTNGRSFAIVSYGQDGEPGGEGYDADISNRS